MVACSFMKLSSCEFIGHGIINGIYGQDEKSVQKGCSFMKEEISATTDRILFALSCGTDYQEPGEKPFSHCACDV